jgi:hypothetical protein
MDILTSLKRRLIDLAIEGEDKSFEEMLDLHGNTK